MRFRTFAATVLMTAALSGLPPSRVAAQGTRPPDRPGDAADSVSAENIRARFHDLMRDYPPALSQVLGLDPSLMNNPAYLAPYPAVAQFLAEHPAVARNPAFFLGDPRYGGPDEMRRYTIQEIENSMAGLAFFLFFMTALGVAAHVGRAILEHRRWLHATRIQTDAHTKLVDRFASNEDLMTYIQSAAGQGFLSGTPLPIDADSPRLPGTAPLGRILTSMQIGIVAACGGVGLWIAKNNVIAEVAQPLRVVSVLAISLGIGFVLSAALSYGLSKHLGLVRSSSHA